MQLFPQYAHFTQCMGWMGLIEQMAIFTLFTPSSEFSVFPLWVASVPLFTAHHPNPSKYKFSNFSLGNFNGAHYFGVSISENLSYSQLYGEVCLCPHFYRHSIEASRVLGLKQTDFVYVLAVVR